MADKNSKITTKEALRIAIQFVEIAIDWNIDEVEIDGVTTSSYDILEALQIAIAIPEIQELELLSDCDITKTMRLSNDGRTLSIWTNEKYWYSSDNLPDDIQLFRVKRTKE